MRVVIFAVLAALLVAVSPGTVRRVSGNGVVSLRDPHARITVPSGSKYVGVDRWVLFGIANCELYAFVRADSQKRVRALYWIQFEGYVPSMPALHHIYTSTRHAKLGDMDFLVDTWTESNANGVHPPNVKALAAAIRAKGYAVPAAINSGSDEQHLYALLRAKGYRMPANVMSVRFVHLVDPQKRKELMIIYSEPLSPAARPALVRRAQRQIAVANLQR